jgi:hypothetical protein
MFFTRRGQDGYFRLPSGAGLLSLRRPEPRYAVAEVVLVKPDAVRHWQPPHYMAIQERRWVRPNGEEKKQWVYDGPILEIKGGKLVWCTNGLCFLEGSLAKLHAQTP